MSPQLPGLEAAEYLQQRGRPGHFSLLAKHDLGMRQQSHDLRQLPEVLRLADHDRDNWITQATFTTSNRRAVNVRDVGLLFADLDVYRSPGLAGKTPDQQADLLNTYCRTEGLPAPSIVLFSGRGLQAKWLIAPALEADRLPEWNAAQLALVRLLEPFSADVAARDISRVLRLDQTTNTKSGERCRVVWTASGLDLCPLRYDFDDLAAALAKHDQFTAKALTRIAPSTSAMPAPTLSTSKVLSLPEAFSLRRLNWLRLYDLRDLWTLRGGVPEGYRELTLFHELCFLLLAQPGAAGDVWKEAQALAAQIAPGENFYQRADLSTVYRKAKAGLGGEVIIFNGRPMPAIYTPRNSTLLELFQVTTAEERTLRTIISGDEKRRRNTERHQAARRAAGVPELAKSAERTRPWEAAGVSRATWYRREAERSGGTRGVSDPGSRAAGENQPTDVDGLPPGVRSQSGTANGGGSTRVGDVPVPTSPELSQEALERLEAFGGA